MKKTKKSIASLIANLVAIILCATLLTGTTFAWFTDEADSNGNIIASGALDVNAYWMEGTEDPETASWIEFEDGPLFDYDKWEPGYVSAKHVKVANEGSLAFKYKMLIIPKNVIADEITLNLADVIDVYYMPVATQLANRTQIEEGVLVGTLAELIADPDGAAYGVLLPEGATAKNEGEAVGSVSVTLALKMREGLGNEYQGLSIGSAFDIKILATQYAYEEDSFGNTYDENVPDFITAANIDAVDFTQENTTFTLLGAYNDITISELGDGSVIAFDDAEVGNLTINDDVVLTGKASITSLNGIRNSEEPIEMTISDATFDINGNLNVKNTLNKSVLNIIDSSVECSFLFVGEHTNNASAALAEFNVVNSYLRCEENALGSTISVWGRSGVKSTIYDSEIHTYSRGWHQSEDANDNAITFQGATSIDVEIQRSNIHTYGYRSIINVRQYGSEATTINASIDDSLIWVITKSTHGEETIPVWGFNEITDTILVFTKDVTKTAVDSSFIYGNPVIHGDFNLRENCNCGWDAHVELDEETVTFASNSIVSVDDVCNGSLSFVLSDNAKVIVEDGASVSGKINIVAADGYTLKTVTEKGVTTYSVTAN